MIIFFRQVDVASFATIGTIVEAIEAQAHAVLRLAEAAILLAGAFVFRFITLRAHCGRHSERPPEVQSLGK
jgi:hypothetical protein